MKKLFRKTMTVLGSVALLGATMSGALAASYPEPFTASNTAVVVGSSAAASDITAATQVATDLGMDAASSSTTTVVGGDSVDLGEVFGDILLTGDIDGNLYNDELSSILGDDSADGVDYTQMVDLGAHTIEFADLGDEDNYVANSDVAEELKPVLYLDHSDGSALWTYTLTFDEDFDATEADNEKIVLAGKEFTIAPDLAAGDDLTLYASSNTVEVSYGQSETVEVAGKDFVIEVTGGRDLDTPEATVSINGASERVVAGDTIENDGEEFYVSEVYMNTFGDANTMSVELFVGADKLVLDEYSDGISEFAELGDELLDSVIGYYTVTTTGQLDDIQTIVLEFTPSEADYDYDAEYQEYSYTEMGEAITDPVLGTFSVFFDSMSQDFTEEKSMIEMSQSGEELRVSFTNEAGTEYTFAPLKADVLNILSGTDFEDLERANRTSKLVLNKEGSSGTITHIAEISSVEEESGDVASVTFAYDGTTEEVNVGDPIRRSADTLYVCAGGSFNSSNSGEAVNWSEDTTKFSIQTAACLDDSDAIADYDDRPLYDGNLDAIYAADDVTIDVSALSSGVTAGNDAGDVVITETNSDFTSTATMTFDVTYTSDEEYTIDVTDDANVEGGEDDEGENGYYLTAAGSYIEVEAEDNTWAKVYTPEEEVTYNVLVATEVSNDDNSGETGGLTVLDSEESAYSGKNLIVVGGSAVNSVAAELLGFAEGENTHGEGFTAKTGIVAGEALIEAFDRDGKVALLVAGYDAADTTKAASYLVGDVDEVSTDAGAKYKVTSQTEATAITA